MKMAPHSLLPPLSSVCFEDKLKFSASQKLSVARSKWFTLSEAESQSDVWSIKPPDFSLKLYTSLSVPQKTERKTHSGLAVPPPDETKRRTGIFRAKLLHESYQREDPPKFITSYRPPDALESELMFVKTGKYHSGPYKNPKPHNFRPVSANTEHASHLLLYVCHVYPENKMVINAQTAYKKDKQDHLLLPLSAAHFSVVCNVYLNH